MLQACVCIHYRDVWTGPSEDWYLRLPVEVYRSCLQAPRIYNLVVIIHGSGICCSYSSNAWGHIGHHLHWMLPGASATSASSYCWSISMSGWLSATMLAFWIRSSPLPSLLERSSIFLVIIWAEMWTWRLFRRPDRNPTKRCLKLGRKLV